MKTIIIDRTTCFECGSTNTIEQHHVVPKIYGGTKTIPLCIKCHSFVHQKDLTKIRELAKIGIEKARARGVKFGRTKGSKESTEKFLSKEKNQQIKEMLEKGYTHLEIKKQLKASPKLIQKVKRIGNIDTTKGKRIRKERDDLKKSILTNKKRIKKSLEELQSNIDIIRELEQSIKSDSTLYKVKNYNR